MQGLESDSNNVVLQLWREVDFKKKDKLTTLFMSHYSLSLKTVCLCGKCDVCECLCDHSCDLKIDFCNMGNIQAIATPELVRLDKQCQSKLPLYFTNECLCPSCITSSTNVGVRTTTAQRIISWKLCDDVKVTVYCNATLKFWHSFAALSYF